MKNGKKKTCLEKHAFDVSEMSITSIITCINMTHTICTVDEKKKFKIEPVCESYGAYDMFS